MSDLIRKVVRAITRAVAPLPTATNDYLFQDDGDYNFQDDSNYLFN